MKKLLIVLLCCSFVFLAAACNSKEVTYDYGFDQMKEVFWESDIVYNESVVMLKDETGTSGSLMFTPKKNRVGTRLFAGSRIQRRCRLGVPRWKALDAGREQYGIFVAFTACRSGQS